MQIKGSYLLLALTWLAFIPLGESQSFDIKNYGFEDGLSHRNVLSIQQDRHGFIWMATVDGLNRFDGYQFLPYTMESTLRPIPHDYLTDLLFDEKGNLWLSSDNHLFRMPGQPGNRDFLEINTFKKDAASVRIRVKNKLCSAGRDKIWVVTLVENIETAYIRQYSSGDSLTLIGQYPHPSRMKAVSAFGGFLFLPDGQAGITVLDTTGKAVYQHRLTLNPRERILQIGKDASQGVWLLSNQGRFFFCPTLTDTFQLANQTAVPFPSGYPLDFWIDKEKMTWIAFENALLYKKWDSQRWADLNPQIEQFIQKSCTYRQILEDNLGVIWVASDYGPIKIRQNNPLFETYLSEGNENCSNGFCSTRGITEDENGNIYISYYNSIHVLYAQQDKLRPLDRQGNFFNFPFDLQYYKNGLYTGNGRKIDLKTFVVDTILHQKTIDKGAVMVDKDSVMWFGYLNHLYQYIPELDSLKEYVDPRGVLDTLQDISYVYQGKYKDIIWVGTNTNGLYGITKEQGCVLHYTQDSLSAHAISHQRINAVYEDEENRLWLATAHGLNCINLITDSVQVYLTEQGLSHNFVNGILPEGDSCLWVSTDNGLCRLSKATGVFVNYFKEDGLSENEFNRISFHRGADGKLYFGGLNGVNSFFPGPRFSQKDRKNGQVFLNSFSYLDGQSDSLITRYLANKEVPTITLGHRDRFFEFSYVLTDFRNPSENLFQYQLEGFEPEWSEPTNLHTVRYHNIPAGTYWFKVRASGVSGGWTEDELRVKVVVKEAFYRKLGFQVSTILLGLSLLFGLYRFRVFQLRRRERFLEKEVQLRTTELAQEKQKADELLLNILPHETAEELKRFGKAKARRYDQVSVLFCDFKDFTKLAERMEPEELVSQIDYHFAAFDRIIERHGLEKIKTVGDAYICAGGIPEEHRNSANAIVEAALEIQAFLNNTALERANSSTPVFEARIGIHTGSVVAGVVGLKKFAYDIWGDAVNIAARMEHHSKPGKVNVSEVTYRLIQEKYDCIYRGKITAKNKGAIDMYFVEGEKKA